MADRVPAGWVLFDASCGLCTAGAERLSPLLARAGLRAAALQEPWVAQRTGLAEAELLQDMCILPAHGPLRRGADAYRFVLARLWWTWPLWLLATVPPTRWLFDLAYRLVARNRLRVSQACGLRPRLRPAAPAPPGPPDAGS